MFVEWLQPVKYCTISSHIGGIPHISKPGIGPVSIIVLSEKQYLCFDTCFCSSGKRNTVQYIQHCIDKRIRIEDYRCRKASFSKRYRIYDQLKIITGIP